MFQSFSKVEKNEFEFMCQWQTGNFIHCWTNYYVCDLTSCLVVPLLLHFKKEEEKFKFVPSIYITFRSYIVWNHFKFKRHRLHFPCQWQKKKQTKIKFWFEADIRQPEIEKKINDKIKFECLFHRKNEFWKFIGIASNELLSTEYARVP